MKLITFEDIQNLNINPYLCYEWVSEMITNKKTVDLPAKISMHPKEGVFCNVMPCVIPNAVLGEIGGVKVVTRYPNRKPSLDSKLLLLNIETGEFLSLMDANWITAMRTGAVAAHSILLFAKRGFSTVAMLGLGNTARATLLVLCAMLPEREFTIKLLKYKGQEKKFIERFAEYPNLKFVYVDNNVDLIKGSEVIISCVTYFEADFCSDEFFDEGVLVVPVHTRGFTNCDLFFDKIYADDYGHVHHFRNFDKFKYFAEVCDVVNGNAAGRENDKEKIIAYNIGISMHDVNFAAHIYEIMQKTDKLLMDIDMCDPTEKFWV